MCRESPVLGAEAPSSLPSVALGFTVTGLALCTWAVLGLEEGGQFVLGHLAVLVGVGVLEVLPTLGRNFVFGESAVFVLVGVLKASVSAALEEGVAFVLGDLSVFVGVGVLEVLPTLGGNLVFGESAVIVLVGVLEVGGLGVLAAASEDGRRNGQDKAECGSGDDAKALAVHGRGHSLSLWDHRFPGSRFAGPAGHPRL